jgi:homoserine O-acetyltransferase
MSPMPFIRFVAIVLRLARSRSARRTALFSSSALGRFTFESGPSNRQRARGLRDLGQAERGEGQRRRCLPSWYGGRALSYQFLVGADSRARSREYFVVATEMFGSGGSSSPSNTPAPYDGPRFPRVAIRDDVEASRQVLRSLGRAAACAR